MLCVSYKSVQGVAEMSSPFFEGFKLGFKNFGLRVAMLVNYVLLTFVYFTAVALTAIVAKLVRKRFLDLQKSDRQTHWVHHNTKRKEIEHYYRQF